MNREPLLSHGMSDLRRVALDAVDAGLSAIDPFNATLEALTVDGSVIDAGGREYRLDETRHIYVVGAGKATLRIAEALERVLGDRITKGVVAVRHSEVRPLSHIEVLGADHPLPGEASAVAARRLLALAGEAGSDDLVIACVTGGSSALACAPPDGVTLGEKRELHRLLLSSGASIQEINTVRKHVSTIKGGRLARAASRARILNLTVSDVAGDPVEYITDLTVQNHESMADAVAVLETFDLWERVPASIRSHLATTGSARLPDLSDVDIHTVMLVTGAVACRAMASEVSRRGLCPIILGTTIVGESQQVGGLLATLARESFSKGRPFPAPCVLLACGGETTVILDRGAAFGSGGPNQELALAAALQLAAREDIVLVAIDTDGSDGGADYAGGIVDGSTLARASAIDLDLRRMLTGHRSSDALHSLRDAVVTGPTGTNVNDLIAIVIGDRR